MISEEVAVALNEQLNREFYSAYLYLGFSSYASSEGFNGSANWFLIRYQEEISHAMKLFKYLEDQNAKIVLADIKAPKVKCNGIVDAFELALQHEQKMTGWLNELSDITMKIKDHATYNMLQWYVTEQVEEEATFGEIIDSIRIVGKDGFGLYTIDKELGQRTFVDATK